MRREHEESKWRKVAMNVEERVCPAREPEALRNRARKMCRVTEGGRERCQREQYKNDTEKKG